MNKRERAACANGGHADEGEKTRVIAMAGELFIVGNYISRCFLLNVCVQGKKIEIVSGGFASGFLITVSYY